MGGPMSSGSGAWGARVDDRLLTVATRLWPGPNKVGLVLARSGDDGTRARMHSLPTLRRSRFVMPAHSGAAVALEPVHTGRRAMKMRAMSLLQRSALLRIVPGRRLEVVRTPGAPSIETVLADVLGRTVTVGIRLGRPRVGRSVVLWAFDDDGAPVAVVKVAADEVARAGVARENLALSSDAPQAVRGLEAPRVLGLRTWEGLDLLVTSAVHAPRARIRHRAPVRAMRDLAATSPPERVRLRDTVFVDALRARIGDLAPRGDTTWLAEALVRLLDELGDVAVTTGAWHGDWVSWNMRVAGDRLLVWDWEYFSADALAGLDHLHYLAQDRRRFGTDAPQEERWIGEARAALGRDWGLEPPQREAVLRAYLLEVNSRWVAEHVAPDPGLVGDETTAAAAPVERPGWGRSLVERLAGPVRDWEDAPCD